MEKHPFLRYLAYLGNMNKWLTILPFIVYLGSISSILDMEEDTRATGQLVSNPTSGDNSFHYLSKLCVSKNLR